MKTHKEIKKQLRCGIKSLKIDDENTLFFWYANNAGRGDNNCTIALFRDTDEDDRPYNTRNLGSDERCLSDVQTSSWRGNVNYSRIVHSELFDCDVEGE